MNVIAELWQIGFSEKAGGKAESELVTRNAISRSRPRRSMSLYPQQQQLKPEPPDCACDTIHTPASHESIMSNYRPCTPSTSLLQTSVKVYNNHDGQIYKYLKLLDSYLSLMMYVFLHGGNLKTSPDILFTTILFQGFYSDFISIGNDWPLKTDDQFYM